jgi:phosphatidylserine decarboxylase
MRIPIAKDSAPFVVVLLVAIVAGGVWRPWLAALPLALLAFVLWFFRDPEREIPSGSGLIVSPADGRVINAEGRRISIFLNVFNVHVTRAPVASRIRALNHTRGKFLAAFKDEASEHNERTTVDLVGPQGELRVVLVAGLVARRIVCWVAEGQRLAVGERMAIIRFGSRVDLVLPEGSTSAVRVGQRVWGGTSVIGRLPSASPDG